MRRADLSVSISPPHGEGGPSQREMGRPLRELCWSRREVGWAQHEMGWPHSVRWDGLSVRWDWPQAERREVAATSRKCFREVGGDLCERPLSRGGGLSRIGPPLPSKLAKQQFANTHGKSASVKRWRNISDEN